MKITICSSMSFANEIRMIKLELEKKGHKVFAPIDAEEHLADPDLKNKITPDYLIKMI
jgi:uncharacterized protein (DUF302 family)